MLSTLAFQSDILPGNSFDILKLHAQNHSDNVKRASLAMIQPFLSEDCSVYHRKVLQLIVMATW